MSVRLIKDSAALLSMRNSDFDAYSAYGEVIDNSIQAEAKNVRIRVKRTASGRKGGYSILDSIVFGDDGIGMPPNVLNRCLQLGYSTTYDSRGGLGRFGVGMTLAAINQCKRVEVYSKVNDSKWMWTYTDLDEITSDPPKMEHIPAPCQKDVPKDLRNLISDKSGTLVIWSKYDRQPCSAEEMTTEMRIWFGRTYRRFIWNGLTITVDGNVVPALDPLYVETRLTSFPDDPPAEKFDPIELKWPIPEIDRPRGAPDESTIKISMSLLPEELRPKRGSGGRSETKQRCIDRNEGISILRNDREVFYGHIPHWPGDRFVEIDRWWGCEISFDGILDQAFTVKNIKRGALPARELKRAIKAQITPTRNSVIERIREYWLKVDQREREKKLQKDHDVLVTGHEAAEQVAATTSTDKSLLDQGKDKDKEAERLASVIKGDESKVKQAAWAAKFADQPFTLLEDSWRGNDFFETNHLGGSDVIRYNRSHPFFERVYQIIESLEKEGSKTPEARELKQLIDLLIISYSKSEAKFDKDQTWTTEKFIEQLRINWGHYLSSYVDTWLKRQE